MKALAPELRAPVSARSLPDDVVLRNMRRALAALGEDDPARGDGVSAPEISTSGGDDVAAGASSSASVVTALADAARRRGIGHDVIVMVDLGDLREGVWPDDLVSFVSEIVDLQGVRVSGLGTSLTCFGGVIPTEEKMQQLVALADGLESTFNLELDYLSGGSSSALPLIAAGKMPPRINHVRIGEAILLGVETAHRNPWPGTHQDAFVLYAEVIELKRKPSVPIGEVSQDAFGKRPVFEDRGLIDRAILNVGREDVDVDGIRPLDPGLRVLGATSGALIVDVSAARSTVRVGDLIGFSLNYAALLQAMDSQYVDKRPVSGTDTGSRAGRCSRRPIPPSGTPDRLRRPVRADG